MTVQHTGGAHPTRSCAVLYAGVVPIERFFSTEGGPPAPWDAPRLGASDLVPTMLTRRELDYLHRLAGEMRGLGRVVELGSFLGGSTAAIVKGLRDSGGVDNPVLVYDAFVAPDEAAFEAAPELIGFGLEPGRSFRSIFDRLHASRAGDIVVREGFLPTSQPDGSIYPESEPIGLLFVDIAKMWGVHPTVQEVFGCHVAPGGALVQQDFGDFRVPWLVIHMWRLRELFTPVHRVGATSTFAFERSRVDAVDAFGELDRDAAAAPDELWVEIAAYWSRVLPADEDAEGWLAGYRAAHAVHAKRWDIAIDAARAHDDWRRSDASEGVHKAPGWDDFLVKLPERIRTRGGDERSAVKADALANERAQHRAIGATIEPKTVWSRVRSELEARGIRSVVLYGGGRHTRRLLEGGWLGPEIEVVRIADDNPAADEIAGVPIARPDDLIGDTRIVGAAVIPSSDAYEAEIFPAAERLAAAFGGVALRAYSAGGA